MYLYENVNEKVFKKIIKKYFFIVVVVAAGRGAAGAAPGAEVHPPEAAGATPAGPGHRAQTHAARHAGEGQRAQHSLDAPLRAWSRHWVTGCLNWYSVGLKIQRT